MRKYSLRSTTQLWYKVGPLRNSAVLKTAYATDQPPAKLVQEEIMEIAVLVIVWLILCFAVGFYAEHKGRSGVGLFFLSFLLSPLVLLR